MTREEIRSKFAAENSSDYIGWLENRLLQLEPVADHLHQVSNNQAKLMRAIKRALQIRNWPTFGSGNFADHVCAFLESEVGKLRDLLDEAGMRFGRCECCSEKNFFEELWKRARK
jgi:hypothetical protein